MKKFYTLLAASVFAVAANAVTISFVQNNVSLPFGEEITFNTGSVDMFGSITYNPGIYVLSDQDVTVNVKAMCLTGQKIQMCCGGDCESGESVTKDNIKLSGGTLLDTQFEYIYVPKQGEEKPSIVTALLAVEKPESLGEYVAELYVNFDLKNSSVSILEADREVVYRNGLLEYNAGQLCEFTIYDSNGRIVYNTSINGQGSINLEHLAQGNYVYRIGNKAGKFFKN